MIKHKLHLKLLTFFVLLSGCASSSIESKAQHETLQSRMDAHLAAYHACMKSAADDYSASSATPHEIADAAHSKCSDKFHAFEKTTEGLLTYNKTYKSSVAVAQSLARDITQEAKSDVQASVVQWVIEHRLKN